MNLEQILRLIAVGQSIFASVRAAIAAWRAGNTESNEGLVRLYRALNPGTTLTDEQIIARFDADIDAEVIDLLAKNAAGGVDDVDALIERLRNM